MGRIGRKVRIREVILQLVIEESLMEFVFVDFDFVIRTIPMAVAMKIGAMHSLVITPFVPSV
jgi:hypothetical protein